MTDKTISLCPICLKRIEATYIEKNDTVFLYKNCQEHGDFLTPVWRGYPSLDKWVKNSPEIENNNNNCPDMCGLCEYHGNKTCCTILNVTDKCNLKCNFCFAGELTQREPSYDYIKKCLDDMADKKITHIHFSGGEPTTRNDIPELAKYAVSKGFKYIQLNTNGLRIARDESYAKKLADAGISAVFLQFDSTDDDINKTVRGVPLLAEKIKAIENCDKANLGVVLVPTLIPGVNTDNIGDIIKFGIDYIPAVRGIHFQPVTYVGKYPENPENSNRITIPEVLRAIEKQTEGMIKTEQFTPSSCYHPMCSFHAEFVYDNERLMPLLKKQSGKKQSGSCCSTDDVPSNAVRKNQNFLNQKWTRPDKCECSEDKTSMEGFLSYMKNKSFTISSKAFQDEYNIDLNRLKRCSLHVYDNGKLIPFCAEYTYHKNQKLFNFPDGC